MQEIHGTTMHYPWGTTDAIPAILGIVADGEPHAEYWLGAHPVSPSTVNGRRLDDVLAASPELLGRAVTDAFDGLPFMMKILSARTPLSLQAHPDADRAAEGFARENAAGIPLDHPLRCYKDPHPKPEVLVALSEFHLLLGFRDGDVTADLFAELGVHDVIDPVIGPLTHRRGAAAIEEVFLDVLSLTGERQEIINQVLVAAVAHADDEGAVGDFARLIIDLDSHFPGEPGIIAACLMNRVVLQPGEAVFIPSGTMHADLSGTGIELLANSDNVIRGGLTKKHIAVDELLHVVDFSELVPAVMTGVEVAPGLFAYPDRTPEFSVWRIKGSDAASIALPAEGSPRIMLITAGHATLTGAQGVLRLEHGQAVFLPADEPPVSLAGDAEAFLVAPGVR